MTQAEIIKITDPELRKAIFQEFVFRGVIGPSYNLDDIKPTICREGKYIRVDFWDMGMLVEKGCPLYEKLDRRINA